MYDASIKKRKDGRLEMQIVVGVDDNGKRVRKSFYGHSEREVKKKRDKWVKETNIYKELKVGKTDAFSSWADIWLETYKKPVVRPYTYENTYRTRVEKYLKPYFKNRDLNAITQKDIQDFFNSHKEVSTALLKTLRIILKNIFDKAIINDLCSKNPVNDIKLSSNYEEKERQAYNAKQQRLAIQWAMDNNKTDILIALKTGIRRGELFGLRWNDVDLKNKIIYINQSISPKVKGVEEIDTKLKSKSSKRAIPIDNELVEWLSFLPNENERLFDSPSVDAFAKKINKSLKQMSKDCNIPSLTLHELRHTFGTVLRENGVDIYSISKLMGHSSVAVTEAIYVHNDIEVLRRAMRI